MSTSESFMKLQAEHFHSVSGMNHQQSQDRLISDNSVISVCIPCLHSKTPTSMEIGSSILGPLFRMLLSKPTGCYLRGVMFFVDCESAYDCARPQLQNPALKLKLKRAYQRFKHGRGLRVFNH
jgi:hypothetical protein